MPKVSEYYCSHCEYDLSGHPAGQRVTCPECGHIVLIAAKSQVSLLSDSCRLHFAPVCVAIDAVWSAYPPRALALVRSTAPSQPQRSLLLLFILAFHLSILCMIDAACASVYPTTLTPGWIEWTTDPVCEVSRLVLVDAMKSDALLIARNITCAWCSVAITTMILYVLVSLCYPPYLRCRWGIVVRCTFACMAVPFVALIGSDLVMLAVLLLGSGFALDTASPNRLVATTCAGLWVASVLVITFLLTSRLIAHGQLGTRRSSEE